MAANESAPQPPEDETNIFLRNTAIAGTVITPIAMLLPPRKVDVRFFVLAGAFSLSSNYLAYSYTGQSFYTRFQHRMLSMIPDTLPPAAERTQQLLREHKQREAAIKAQPQAEDKDAAQARLAKKVEDVWLGGEDKDWQKKRAEEHQKQFDEGKGMGSIIIEQIADVWSGNWKPSSKTADDETTPRTDPTTPEKR